MIPLATNRLVFTWLNICPVKETAIKQEKILYNAFTVLIYIVELSTVAGSVSFLLKYSSINLDNAFTAFFQIDIMLGFVYMTTSAYISHQKITAIFENLAEIYNARNDNLIQFQSI